MIELYIVSTGKSYGRKGTWYTFDSKKKTFPDILAAKKYLKDTYGNCKRSPMYIDKKDNQGAIQCGYVFKFHNSDIKWIQNDWVEFREVKTLEIKSRML